MNNTSAFTFIPSTDTREDTLTVTHIHRPFYRGSDGYARKSLPDFFYRRVPFYTASEEGFIFHVKDKTQYISPQSMEELKANGLVIELPYGVEIQHDQSLYQGLASSVYVANKYAPKWQEVVHFCALESIGNYENVSYISGDSVKFYDILVITHLLVPAEGYPIQPGVLRAMTAVTKTYTKEQGENIRFGPRRLNVYSYKTQWPIWESQDRIIKLDKTILFDPGQWNVDNKDLGQGFWTDHTKEHFYGKVPQEAKCSFYTHVILGSTRPFENEIVRRLSYYAKYYLLDVGLTMYSNSPSDDRSANAHNVQAMLAMEEKKEVVKLPYPLRRKNNNTMFWASANGNIYLAHSIKPNDHPYELIMNTPLISELPDSKDKYVQFFDFDNAAV